MFTGATVIAADDAPLFQVYVDAPLAVKVAACPVHTEGEDTLTTGKAVTLIVPLAAEEQPAVVPVTVYAVLAAGDAANELFVEPLFQL